MDEQDKKLKSDITTTPRQNSLPGLYRYLKTNDLFPLVTWEDYENLFQSVLLSVNIFKTCNRRMHFLLEGPFSDFEQKPDGYN